MYMVKNNTKHEGIFTNIISCFFRVILINKGV